MMQNIALCKAIEALQRENEAVSKYADSLFPFFQATPYMSADIANLEHVLALSLPFLIISEARTLELNATERTLNTICETFSDPDFLIYYAFKNWKKSIQADGSGALEWIADEWLSLVSVYNQRYQEKYGRQSPIQSMQGGNVNIPQMQTPRMPAPPIPSYNGEGGNPIDILKQRIEMMKNPNYNLGAELQRQHTMNRPQVNVVEAYL